MKINMYTRMLKIIITISVYSTKPHSVVLIIELFYSYSIFN